MASNKETIKKYFEDLVECTHLAIIQTLAYCGEVAVRTAREPHPNNWDDHTGNLRSSIGYIITFNGQDVTPKGGAYSAFSERELQPTHKENVSFTAYKGTPKEVQVSFAAKVEAGTEGAKEGERFAESLKPLFPEGYALIVVAGMNYAESVEAHGRDVLASAETRSREQWRKMQNRIPEKIESKMKEKGW